MPDPFDSEAFYAALNTVRLSRQLTWKDVAAETGVIASSLSRLGSGTNPDANSLAALLGWSGLDMKSFIRGADEVQVESIAKIAALLRADRKLSSKHAKLIEEIVVSAYNSLKER